MIEVRPATDADIATFFGGQPPEALRQARLLAYAGVDGDKVLGIGGVLYMPDGLVLGFLDLSDEGRRHAVTLHRAAIRFLRTWRERGHRTLRITIDRSKPRAEAWARRLHFEPLHDQDGVWACRL